MSDSKRILSATKTILKVLVDGVSAYNGFKKGKDVEAWKHTISGTSKLIDGWDDIKYTYEELSNFTNKFLSQALSRTKLIYEGKIPNVQLSLYAGAWHYNDEIFILDHDKGTNLSSLAVPRKNGNGWNIYHGSYEPTYNRFIWIGLNSENNELVILGTLQENWLIFADVWAPMNNGDLKYGYTIDLLQAIKK